MSQNGDDDRALDDATLRALRENDDLVPTSEAEVERAEATLSEDAALPEGLQRYRGRPVSRRPRAPGSARSLPPRRTSATGYVITAGLGALAAGAALSWLSPPVATPVTSAGGELVRPSASAHAPPVPLVFQSRCERGECCAGSGCKTAAEGLSVCPSGIRCVACTPDNVAGGPYRLRIGTVIPSEAGQKLLPLSAPLELCVAASSTDTLCLPAFGESGDGGWRLLKAVSPLQDLLTGLTVQLRKRGETAPLASWRHAVSPTPDIMCKGLAIQLSDGTDTLGRLSAFIEPTHFVELGRAAAVGDMLQTLRRFDVAGTPPRIYETSQSGASRFALVLGPFDKPDAEALRWQVLDHGLDASISYGLDFVGSPRPMP